MAYASQLRILTFAFLYVAVHGCGTPPETVSGSNSASGMLQAFPIHKLKKCIGDGNFEIAGLTNMSQMTDCSLACLEYGCTGINIHQTSKTTFACYILTRISSIVGSDGWACYYLQ
uniref:Apple domain-containing protein n=1 Tax=Parascaris univalens TaxID=6257 RepID=A0A915CED2_PARUN